jgi:hypothetical protein
MRSRTAAGATKARSSCALRLVQYVQFWLHVMFVRTRSLRMAALSLPRSAGLEHAFGEHGPNPCPVVCVWV